MNIISDNIAKLRKESGFTQKEFAKKIGVSQPSLIKFEKGEDKIIPIGVAIKIAKELNVSFNELFGIEGSSEYSLKQTIRVNEMDESIKNLEERLTERKLTIDLLLKEKARLKKVILHHLKEYNDTQKEILDEHKSVLGLTDFQVRKIQNNILNRMNKSQVDFLISNELLDKEEWENVGSKYNYKGLVRPGDYKKE